MMKPKFEMGDRVIYKPQNYVGTICGVCQCSNIYTILLDDNGTKYSALEEDIEFVNTKAAFLTRLQELLATFDASIYDYEQYKLCIDLGCGEQLGWYWGDKPMNECMLTAENVFDYDKD